ncbi:hypothetical protein RFI_18177 [Reticulomyxa filosa]|uniref:RGS domain-containing protein n=1 Tax=Reticulomyxa filosa TaxID=46433 RepID=X6MZ20_RETFI|nr:hypothetical protein RFI_18177 [Reticulomyxa filosa]|eukprot:ETO19061.1 hypothetical protein RFI_18177 [Reticulomyxa filosa]
MTKRKWKQDSGMDVVDPLSDYFVLNAELPQSSIVNNDQLSNEQKAISLIEKYIAVGAQYEVNLSFDTRMDYIKLLHHCQQPQQQQQQQQQQLQNEKQSQPTNPFDLISPSDFVFLFDPVLTEMFRLMRCSYSRFATTTAYRNYVEYVRP